jgi:hypothetical protein
MQAGIRVASVVLSTVQAIFKFEYIKKAGGAQARAH